MSELVIMTVNVDYGLDLLTGNQYFCLSAVTVALTPECSYELCTWYTMRDIAACFLGKGKGNLASAAIQAQ